MKTAREVLEKYFSWTTYGYGVQVDTKKQIDLALTDLSEIVMARLKENICISPKHDSERGKGYRDCITDIAKLFTDKEKTK